MHARAVLQYGTSSLLADIDITGIAVTLVVMVIVVVVSQWRERRRLRREHDARAQLERLGRTSLTSGARQSAGGAPVPTTSWPAPAAAQPPKSAAGVAP